MKSAVPLLQLLDNFLKAGRGVLLKALEKVARAAFIGQLVQLLFCDAAPQGAF